MSDPSQFLKTLLQVHLASDIHAVLHLPYVLSSLGVETLRPSEHLQKWAARTNSLILSKDGGACWAGLCLALQTADLSRDLMVECAQMWVGVTMPLLSKAESVPILKAAIRLLQRIFTGAMDVPEYQRQVCTPNVPKFCISLISLGEKNLGTELKVLIFETLSHLIPIYPSLHRASQTALTNFAMKYLNGSSPQWHLLTVVEAASKLNSVLHHMGGKVAAATQWRKSVDDTLSFCWGALSSLRTTFPAGDGGVVPMPTQGDPVSGIPLNLDRLRVGILVLRDLMYSSNPRPIVLPVGQVARLCIALLRCSTNEIVDGHVDPLIRTLELSVTPQILMLGTQVVDAIANCARQLLAPHDAQLLFYITHHLEQPYPSSHRLHFLHSAQLLLRKSDSFHDSLLLSRLTRATLSSIVAVLCHKNDVHTETGTAGLMKSRKGKKRARGYEGDEVFKMTRAVICSTEEDGDVLLAALDVIQILLEHGPLSPPTHSTAARVMLSLNISLPLMSPSLLSSDRVLHSKVQNAVVAICVQLGYGTTSIMSKGLGIVIGTSMQNGSVQIYPKLDVLLHPRVPPLVRSLPDVETFSLYRTDEGQEELEIREALHLGAYHDSRKTSENAIHLLTLKQSEPNTSSVHLQATNPRSFGPPGPSAHSPTTPTKVIQLEPTRSIMALSERQTEPPDLEQSTLASAVISTTHASEPTSFTPSNSFSIEEPRRTSPLQPVPSVTPADVRMIPVDLEDEDEPIPSIDIGTDSDQDDSSGRIGSGP